MSYAVPNIDDVGIHLNSFNDIQNYLIVAAQSIFGQDIYLDSDSQDMQYIGVISKAIFDTEQLAQLVYNNQSPNTAIGAGLSSLVKINGITRKPSTYSTWVVTCYGVPGTLIPAGVVRDANGYNWALPANQIIPDNGILSITMTCTTPGNITGIAGSSLAIVNQQYGWSSVTAPANATPGMAIETDAELRDRQGISVQLPSQTPIDGTQAALETITGVDRVKCYENNTAAADANGVPGHSIACIVHGGDDTDVATAIAQHKTIGCGTYGTTAVTLPVTQYSVGGAVNFYRPTMDTIAVQITVVQNTGYTQAIQDAMIAAIQSYLNNLPIGTSVQASSVYFAALSTNPDISSPAFGITALTVNVNGGAFGASAAVGWNELAQAGAVTVTGGL